LPYTLFNYITPLPIDLWQTLLIIPNPFYPDCIQNSLWAILIPKRHGLTEADDTRRLQLQHVKHGFQSVQPPDIL